MEKRRRCGIGVHLKLQCSQEKAYKTRKGFSERDYGLIERRTSCFDLKSICSTHEKRFLSHYALSQKVCCNPFQAHGKITKSLRKVHSDLDLKCAKLLPTIIEGKKLCPTCRNRVLQVINPKSEKKSLLSTTTRMDAKLVDRLDAGETAPKAVQVFKEGSMDAEMALPSTSSGQQHAMSERSTSTSDSERIESSGSIYSPKRSAVDKLNRSMQVLGESPIVERNLARSEKYSTNKLRRASAALKETFESAQSVVRAATEGDNTDPKNIDHNSCISYDEFDYEKAGREMLKQLKEKFDQSNTMREKILILSVCPKSWSKQKITTYFGCTKYIVNKMMHCVQEKGIFCTTDPGKGKLLSDDITHEVQKFYREPDISRELSGKKDFKSVFEDGKRVHKQKRLVLGSLRDIYEEFKKQFPDSKLGFSKFCTLRPPECVLAGASGTHSVCVCQIHQNFKLMFSAARLDKLQTSNEECRFKEYRDALRMILCTPSSSACCLGTCAKCPGGELLRETLETVFGDNFVEEITYYQWRQVDRFFLDMLTKPVDDFVEEFLESAPAVVKHDFIAKNQSNYFKKVRENIQKGEVLVVADFSENYHFILQDSVQGFHWDNTQATIHPFASYVKSPGGKVVPLNFVIISDSYIHNTAAVHAFQRKLVDFLKKEIPNLTKIIYFSDGAPSQYKNRYNIMNLAFHEQDFHIKAEWHFFATSHSKGPSDGLGGVLKRNAARASLQRSYDRQIKTPLDLYNWAVENLKNINFCFVSEETVFTESKALGRRFREAPEIRGIRQHHAAIPIAHEGQEVILMKNYSESKDGFHYQVWDQDDNIEEDKVDEPATNMRITRSVARKAAENKQQIEESSQKQ